MKAENAKLAVTNSELTKIKDELSLEKETWSKTKCMETENQQILL